MCQDKNGFHSYIPLIAIFIFCYLGYSSSFARPGEELGNKTFAHAAPDAILYARFIEQLSNELESPDRITNNNLCIFGKDEITEALIERSKNITSIDISSANLAKEYSKCKLVYFAKNRQNAFFSQVQLLRKAGIATISTIDNFDKNGGVFYIKTGRRNFEVFVNHQALKQLQIRPSPSLLEVIVNKEDRA